MHTTVDSDTLFYFCYKQIISRTYIFASLGGDCFVCGLAPMTSRTRLTQRSPCLMT